MSSRRFSKLLRSLPGAVRSDIAKAMYTAGSLVAVEAQISITTGAVSGKGHVPSRPGEPPNNDSATLANGIQVRQVAPLHVEIASTAPYSRALEYGTSRMAARPFMAPAAARARPKVVKQVTAAAKRSIREHMRKP